MSGRTAMAIDLGRRRLRAVWGEQSGSRFEVRAALVEDRPESIGDEPAAIGAWVGQALERAGFPRRRATVAMAREHLVLKRIVLPTTESEELPDMTRLALQRDLPFDAEKAVIDFLPQEQGEQRTTVLAVAVPDAAVERARATMKAAGITIERLTIRALGSSALVASMGGAGASVLVVDVGVESVEFSAVVDGGLRFSRAADLPELPEPPARAEAVLTEARRTWLSYRMTEGSRDVERVVVVGDEAVAPLVAETIGAMLSVEAAVLKSHPCVNLKPDVRPPWSLIGLLVAPILDRPLMDANDPRRPPDLAARKRQRWMLTAGAVTIVLMGLWTTGRFHARGLQSELDAIGGDRNRLREPYAQHVRDRLRLEHLRRWDSMPVDWLGHAVVVGGLLPPPEELVLDGWSGSRTVDAVRYDRRAEGEKWSVQGDIGIVVEGEAVDRATADAFRASLVDLELYTQSSSGADAPGGRRLPFGFTYRLLTTDGAPLASGEGSEG